METSNSLRNVGKDILVLLHDSTMPSPDSSYEEKNSPPSTPESSPKIVRKKRKSENNCHYKEFANSSNNIISSSPDFKKNRKDVLTTDYTDGDVCVPLAECEGDATRDRTSDPLNCCQNYNKKNFSSLPPSTMGEKLKLFFQCPPGGIFAEILVQIILLVFIWGILWSVIGVDALPGGNIFALLVLGVVCTLGGKLMSFIHLPPLLGMLIVGFLLRNVSYVNVAVDLKPVWSSNIRSIALVVILTRAGLGLDSEALKRLSCVCVRLAFTPCLMECVSVAIFSHLLLGFPWLWGFIFGFVLAAVSPAVVVPCMLDLQERGFGVAKGIPTLVIAASSVDDVLAITGFGIALGMTFSTGNLTMTILTGPIEVAMGLTFGVALGLLFWFLPQPQTTRSGTFRFVMLFCASLFALFGSRAIDFSGAGPLGCLVIGFVAALRWRKDKTTNGLEGVSDKFAVLWFFFQPLLFGLIGAEVTIDSLQGNSIGLGIAVLAIGLVFRVIVTYLVVIKSGFVWREQLFIALAWLPKATVQAAIGPVALDLARSQSAGIEAEQLAMQVLTLAVVAILITAPLGAVAVTICGPFLLEQDSKPANNKTTVIANNIHPEESMHESIHL